MPGRLIQPFVLSTLDCEVKVDLLVLTYSNSGLIVLPSFENNDPMDLLFIFLKEIHYLVKVLFVLTRV